MRTLAHARRVVLAGLLVFDAMLGCVAPSTQYRSSEPASKAHAITSAEIESVLWRTVTAADIIRTLRPGMLDGRYPSARSSATSGRGQITRSVRVYVDNIPYGEIETLATIPALSVRGVRRFSRLDAKTRFGSDHPNGAIVVGLPLKDEDGAPYVRPTGSSINSSSSPEATLVAHERFRASPVQTVT